MEGIVLGIAGILVSISLFWIGYRQTIGAKRERVHSANKDLESILVRRIILESYTPSIDDLTRLIEGKAMDFSVRVENLISESQLLNAVFTKILETDFISPKQRKVILDRILPLLNQADREAPEEAEIQSGSSSSITNLLAQGTIPVALALTATLLSALLTLLPNVSQLGHIPSEALTWAGITGAVTLLLTGTFIIVNRITENQKQPSKGEAIRQYANFEQDVIKYLLTAGIQISIPDTAKSAYDFEVLNGSSIYLIEVKGWPQSVPISLVRNTASRLAQAIRARKARSAFIVVKEHLRLPADILSSARVRIVTPRQLRNILIHKMP